MLEKWPFLDQNNGLTPLEKNQFFDFLNFLFFFPQKGVFLVQNIIDYIFLVYIAKNKKVKQWPFLDQNHGLTPLAKCDSFYFLNFSFFQPRKAFFRSRISQNTFFRSIMGKKKSWKKGHFWTKTIGRPLWKKINFLTF